jgi:hypothetical protein
MIVEGLGDLPVFPCRADKMPLTRNGFYNAVHVEPEDRWPLVGVRAGALVALTCSTLIPMARVGSKLIGRGYRRQESM